MGKLLWILVTALATAVGSLQVSAEEGTQTVIDLSHEFFEGMPTFPGGIPFELEAVATHEESGYFASRLKLGEHTGTHMDAPIHFQQGKLSVEAIPPSRLIGPGLVISIASKASAEPEATLEPADLTDWEQHHGPIPAGSFVLIHTGWSARWGDEATYRNADAQGVMRFPGLSEAGARALRDRKISGVGIDTLSIDPGFSTEFAAHKVLASANLLVIENLTNLEQLPARGFRVVVAPLKIRGGSGSPARVLAILDR